jgi:hypothetical protein
LFLALPEVSLPRRRSRNIFGVTPHPRGESDTITFHFVAGLLIFFAARFAKDPDNVSRE